MKHNKISITLNINLIDLNTISELAILAEEYSLQIEDILNLAVDKFIKEVDYYRSLRTLHQKKQSNNSLDWNS